MQTKYKLILDVSDDGTWNIDVRDNGTTIGHILLSATGVSWKDPHGKVPIVDEVTWSSIRAQLAK